jgi:DNA invertase Pin-like site-specific DNA recombinase
MMNMLGSFSQFEREIIRERTMAGLRQARELSDIKAEVSHCSPSNAGSALSNRSLVGK